MLHLITVGMKEKMSEKGIFIILKKVCGEKFPAPLAEIGHYRSNDFSPVGNF